MCPLRKTMKIAHLQNHYEKEHLKFFKKITEARHIQQQEEHQQPCKKTITNTHISLRKPIKEEDCIRARNKDYNLKQERTYRLKSSEY